MAVQRAEWALGEGWGLVNAVALAALGCGAPSSSESANEPKVAIDGVIVCRRSQTLPTGEVEAGESGTSLFAMNNKLKHYPEFAATTGMELRVELRRSASVVRRLSCVRGGASRLRRQRAHRGLSSHSGSPRPSQERATVVEVGEISKIQNGVNDFLKPVVFLDNTQQCHP